MPAPLDVSVERTIPAPPERVASVMFGPSRDSQWMKAALRADLARLSALVQQADRS